MRLTITAALAAASLLASAHSSLSSTRHQDNWSSKQQQWGAWQAQPVVHKRVHVSRHSAPAPTESKLKAELASLRREIDGLKREIAPHAWNGVKVPFFDTEGDGGFKLASLPDLRLPEQEPAIPVVVAPMEADAVAEALGYLKRTATLGYTMARQGVDVAIGRLHPAFVVRLAEAIHWAREHDLPHAGIYSAYRPPAFGVGGFGNKFFSMHSYGLAADITGIGGPGSRGARTWEQAVRIAGLFLPYGVNNRAEFNHTQLLSSRMAWMALRRTITASAPKGLREMWLASGVKAYVPLEAPRDVAVK